MWWESTHLAMTGNRSNRFFFFICSCSRQNRTTSITSSSWRVTCSNTCTVGQSEDSKHVSHSALPTDIPLATQPCSGTELTCAEHFSMTVFTKWRISILAVGSKALEGVMIPAVLGGGFTPTWDREERGCAGKETYRLLWKVQLLVSKEQLLLTCRQQFFCT